MYLNKRRQTWYLEWSLPADLRKPFGKRNLVKSLKTRDRNQAEHHALAVKAMWRAQAEAHRRAAGTQPSDVSFWREMMDIATSSDQRSFFEQCARNQAAMRDPLFWRAEISAASPDERQGVIQQLKEYSHENVLIAGVAEGVLDYGDPRYPELAAHAEQARFVALATGKIRAFDEHVDEWAATLRVEAKTLHMRRSTIREFTAKFPLTSDVTRKAVQRWAHEQVAAGKSAATVARALSELRGYWRFLRGLEAVPEEARPFDDIDLPRRSAKEAVADKRKPFEPADISRLYEAARADDQQLADLINIARWTGARIEEICSLRKEDASVDALKIVNAKTAAGNREIPVHPELKPTIRRLLKEGRDDFLLSGLVANKYGDRAGALSKRFGRLRASLGFGSQTVFHSIRKTVATLLEDAKVEENVAADILGHEKPRITYGLYSGGTSLATKLKAISKLKYPQNVYS